MTNDIQSFDFSVNLLRSILWQYNDAVNLQSLLEQKNEWYVQNHQLFWEDWIRDVFDLRTANQFGLVVWGIILGLQLYVNQPPQVDNPTWGFADEDVNYDNGNYTPQNGETYYLPPEIQRIALQLRYVQLTSAGCVPEINRHLKRIFGSYGKVWLLDYGTMTQAYIFEFPLTAQLRYLFDNYDILPRPAGVKSGYLEIDEVFWGFADEDQNYDNAPYGENV